MKIGLRYYVTAELILQFIGLKNYLEIASLQKLFDSKIPKKYCYNSSMTIREPGLNGERRIALVSDLKSLSGKYGKIERRANGTMISNDEGYRSVIPGLKEHLANKQGGIGIFVGSGGLLSLLPDLPIDAALVLDMNPAVLELNEVVAKLVEGSASPDEVFQRLTDPDFRKQSQILRDIDEIYGDIDMTTGFLNKESREYGEYHWTHPSRFNQVKEALNRKPVVYVATNITDENFGSVLSKVAQQYGKEIPFANFTNVHAWIKPTTMDFIRNWPFEPDAAILYSSHKDGLVGDWPKMYLAKSPDEYIAQTKVDS